MVEIYEEQKSSVIAVETVPRGETKNYGIVSLDKTKTSLNRIKSIVEKPSPDKAPSNLAVVGRYILTPEIINLLETTKKGAGGEIQLTDAIAELLKKESVYALKFEGTRYDCGSKLGYLQANVEYGLKHPELGEEFSEYLSKLTRS